MVERSFNSFAKELRLADRLQALHPAVSFEASWDDLDDLHFAMLDLAGQRRVALVSSDSIIRGWLLKILHGFTRRSSRSLPSNSKFRFLLVGMECGEGPRTSGVVFIDQAK